MLQDQIFAALLGGVIGIAGGLLLRFAFAAVGSGGNRAWPHILVFLSVPVTGAVAIWAGPVGVPAIVKDGPVLAAYGLAILLPPLLINLRCGRRLIRRGAADHRETPR